MIPQIIGYEPGHHNTDMESSTLRIRQGATWKKQRVIILMPAAQTIPTKVAMAHWSIMTPPNQGVHRIACLGDEVGIAYSNAIEDILKHPDLSQWEYLFTLEHDNLCPPDILLRLIKDMEEHPEYSCIAGLYWMKGYGGSPMIYGDPKEDPVVNYRPQPPRANEVQEAYGLGMGANLWRLSMFKDEKLRRPWFKTVASLTEGIGTQDLYAFGDMRKHGYRVACDTSISVGHYDFEGKFGIPDFTW